MKVKQIGQVKFSTYQGETRARWGTRWRVGEPVIYRLSRRISQSKTFDRYNSLDQDRRDGKSKNSLTFRNSLSSWGGYRGGCGPDARDGEDLLRRTPNLPRRRVLLPRVLIAGCTRDKTKVIDGSVGSGERIVSLSLSPLEISMKRQEEEHKGEPPGWERR